MEILSSRILLRPADRERALRFYEETLGLAVYREWGEGPSRCAVFFLGGGFLEVSGRPAEAPPADGVRIWLQVRDVRAVRERLAAAAVPVEEPELKPWGLVEMVARDPDGVALVFVEVPPEHPLRRRS